MSDGNGKFNVPLHQPFIEEEEHTAVREVLDSGQLKGGGRFDEKCSQLLEKCFSAHRVLMTTSCTHALEMAAILLEVGPGDEVILPSFTFTSTATAFYRRGADLTFCDVCPDTLNLDHEQLERLISGRTKVVIPVHYGGVGCEMDPILGIASEHGTTVVEDAAQGVNAKYRSKYLGTMGALGCFSFHATKNYVAGEGGALLINDDEYTERAEIIREKGTNYNKFRRGEVDRYTWVDTGSSYVPSELQMAVAFAQLQKMEVIRKEREEVFTEYMKELQSLSEEGHIRLPYVPPDRTSNYHIFHVRTRNSDEREQLLSHLRREGVEAAFHYQPLHSSPMGRRVGADEQSLPVTERAAQTLIRLPIYPGMARQKRKRVTEAVKSFYA